MKHICPLTSACSPTTSRLRRSVAADAGRYVLCKMNKLDRSIFLKELKNLFPEIRHDINQEYGLLHLEMHVFARFVQDLIDKGDKDNLIRSYQIIDKYLRNGNDNLVSRS